MFTRLILKLTVLAMVFGVVTGCAGMQAGDKKPHNIVIQVIDNDPGRWKQTLSIVKNLKKDMGKDNLAIEIVAHGGGINMILKESEVANLLADAQKDGVVLAACAASMKGQKVNEKDLFTGVSVVPFGAKEIMQKQEAGWSYLRM
mgnify:CR=1 FL=1